MTPLWRDTYRATREQAIARYQAKPQPARLFADLTRAADQLLQAIWGAHDLPQHTALLAVGGYGRGELYPQSDIDMLILVMDDLDEASLHRFEPLIGLFWDVGLPVGHSVRRLSECLDEAANDLSIHTNLLEGRPLCGDLTLADTLLQRIRMATKPLDFLEAKRLEQAQRHGRFADRALMLEPNLKESPGGLRDLHTIGWVARACGLPDDLPGLARAGMLTASESRRLTAHRNLLAHLRIRLHLAANRREDRLVFEQQERIAADLGITVRGRLRASEVLMQRFFRAAREIALANEILLGGMQCRLGEAKDTQPLPDAPDFGHRNALLDIRNEALFETRPAAILESFAVLARHPELSGFTPPTLRALWRAAPRIDAAFRRQQRAALLALFCEPNGITRSIRLLHRLGLLERLIPPFARITGQMQHDLYHIHPVDEHSLMLLRNLRRFALPILSHEFPLASELMQSFARPHLMYITALFHDIAKGRGGDHSVLGAVDARRFCRQLGLPDSEVDLVAWLVHEHLSLSQTAQRQDLSDPEVLAAFAAHMQTRERLDALYLLTVADIRATNPAIWNAWKGNLLKTLYWGARRVIEGQEAVSGVEEKCAAARTTLRLYGWEPGAENLLWRRMDALWFLRLSDADIAWQTRVLLPHLSRQQIIVKSRLSPLGAGAEVLAYAPDRPGLFAELCRFFAGEGLSVLEARIHTTKDGYALDNFLVMDPQQGTIAYRNLLAYLEHELLQALQHRRTRPPQKPRLPRRLRAFPITPQISLTPSEGRDDWVLSLTAGDRPGLLADIAEQLAEHGIEVNTARIHTLGGRAEDVFVVRGNALHQTEAQVALERALLARLAVEG